MKVLYLTIVVVIIDQITKLSVKGFSIPFLNLSHKGMFEGQRIPVFGDFLRLTFIENPGMAFGYDPGSSVKIWITLFSLVASIGLIYYIFKVKDKSLFLRTSLALILGGAIGNLIDRMFYGVFFNYGSLFYGKVVDFIDVDFFDITLFGRYYDRFPIFNIADAAVSIGVVFLLFFYEKAQKEETNQDVAKESSSDVLPGSENPIIAEENNGQNNNRESI